MKDYQKKLFAVFLIFLVANQHFGSAKALTKPEKLKITTEEDVGAVAVAHHRESRHRRFAIGAVIFGVAIFAAIANLALDVYLKIDGCCGFFPDACTYEKDFNDVKDNIEATSTLIDERWLLSTNLLTYISTASLRNEEIALEMKRITEVFETIINTIDADTIIAYNNISAELKKAIEDKNQTVLNLSFAELDFQYQSLLDSKLGRLQLLSGLIGGIAVGVLGWSWNYYKTAQMQTMLKTKYGALLANPSNSKLRSVLGVGDNVDDFIKQTAVAQRKANVATSRGAKVLSVAGSVIGVIAIGAEIYAAIVKIQQCRDIRDAIKLAYEEIQPAEANVTALYTDVTENYNDMSESWDFLKGELRSEVFIDYLFQIKNMSDSISTPTPMTQQTSASIQGFIDNINGTEDISTIISYQDSLIQALENTTFTLSCLSSQVKVFAKVAERCQAGDGKLLTLFEAAVVDFNANATVCTSTEGIAFTQFFSVEAYVIALAAELSFNADCPLNDPTAQASVCANKCTGHTSAEIAFILSITEEYVVKFLEFCPAECPIPPGAVTNICNLKAAGVDLATALLVFGNSFTESQITTTYNACPPPS